MTTTQHTKNITRVSIFDFDGTLINTPLPDTGKAIYHQKTGNEWPHTGWWGKEESLDSSIFDMPLVEAVIADYKEEIKREDTLTVMITGRMTRLASNVKKILDENGLTFHELHFNTGGSTDAVKINTFEDILARFPEIEEISIWEDRIAHVGIFEQWGREKCEIKRLKDFKITVVISENHK